VVTNLSIYATGSYMDGGEEIICVKIGDLITTTHTWRGLEGFLSTKGGHVQVQMTSQITQKIMA
jgi:hypothetical protein